MEMISTSSLLAHSGPLPNRIFLSIGRVNPYALTLFSGPFRRKRQTQDDYIPVYFEQLTFTDMQRTLCEDNKECLYDLVQTGEMGVALETLNQQKETNETRTVLSKCVTMV